MGYDQVHAKVVLFLEFTILLLNNRTTNHWPFFQKNQRAFSKRSRLQLVLLYRVSVMNLIFCLGSVTVEKPNVVFFKICTFTVWVEPDMTCTTTGSRENSD